MTTVEEKVKPESKPEPSHLSKKEEEILHNIIFSYRTTKSENPKLFLNSKSCHFSEDYDIGDQNRIPCLPEKYGCLKCIYTAISSQPEIPKKIDIVSNDSSKLPLIEKLMYV
ncbi:hypothetical protein GF361_01795 [Candidatus Woesearchaeota archaeon]|nr:hypothetical protein [Candidatus Woesearchaeota archaeon]